MLNSQKLTLELSKQREQRDSLTAAINKAVTDGGEAAADDLTALEKANEQIKGIEVRYRAAVSQESEQDDKAANDNPRSIDPEIRERLELRSKARVSNFLSAAMRGRAVTGADAELHEACELDAGQIPLELWETPTENRDTENRATTVTPAPGTVGVNLDPIRPAVFAPSVADKLQVDMPTVKSGTYATGTVSASVTGDAVAERGGRAANGWRDHCWEYHAKTCGRFDCLGC